MDVDLSVFKEYNFLHHGLRSMSFMLYNSKKIDSKYT